MAPLIALGGGVTSALLTGAMLSGAGRRALEEVPEYGRKPSTFQTAKKDYGVNVGYVQAENLANALSVPKESLRQAYKVSKGSTLKVLLNRAKKHGLVVIGEGYRRPGVVEHELGHAIARHKGTPWERFTQSGAAPVLGTLSTLAGIGAGLHAGRKWGPLAGGLAGLGVAGLGNIPNIHGEHIANLYGQELLPDDAEPVKTWPFLGSYLNVGLTAPTVTGAIAGALGRK